MSQHTNPTKPDPKPDAKTQQRAEQAEQQRETDAGHKPAHGPGAPVTGPAGGRGQNEGIGTESNPHGAAPADPRKNRGQNEGLGTESDPHGATSSKKGAGDFARSDAPQKPVSSGPTMADADAPIVEGHEGDEYETVRLTDGPVGPDDGVKVRVAKPLPLVVVSGGRRYMRSTKDLYVIQVP